LTACDVQFTADSIYTKAGSIVWKLDGQQITSFTPESAGVTKLTATSGGITRNIYVVTRNLSDGEFVLYRNDFDTAPTDFRVVQQTGATAYHDGDGHYVIDASSSNTAYGRVLLPAFLDDFGDFTFEARYKDDKQNTTRNWASVMARVQNGDYPYMTTVNGLGDNVQLEYPNGMISWLTAQTSDYDGAKGVGTGNINVDDPTNLIYVDGFFGFFELIYNAILKVLRIK
jgi:hypothetical protein